MSLDVVGERRRQVNEAKRALWAAVSDTLDAGVPPVEVAEFLRMHPTTMYRHLKRWGPPDRRGDGRKRFWTDGARFHRGVRSS